MDIPTITTERLMLRTPREQDLDAFARIMCDEENTRFIGGPAKDRMECWNGIARWLGHWTLRGYGMFAVEERITRELVGRVGLINPAGWPGVEIGWLIDKRRWGEGFAPEAALAVLSYALDAHGVDHPISLIHRENQASIRVAEKIGESFERVLEGDDDLLVYGIALSRR